MEKSEVKKIATTDKQKVRFNLIALEREIHQNDDEKQKLKILKNMKVEKNNELIL